MTSTPSTAKSPIAVGVAMGERPSGLAIAAGGFYLLVLRRRRGG